ncbi:hypothetical protein MKJ04_12150 [Pontibacter sp. E15-1]|uniref:hypothetical protein n=1 Tax=Pontibacter sp. E15-1 TaxID=2919918 RepID=UPI001F4FA469|nr:hypothetical protein [Pontibacter sp. E15-1]MCJ8165594.1 hypothetical protein [Pontibacter sp. E15-1]
MDKTLPGYVDFSLQTECGKTFGNVFKAIKLVRDEQHNFHIVYKTFSDEYIYSFCNPFQDDLFANVYRLISEPEAKRIFQRLLSQENASELFNAPAAASSQFCA